MRYLPIHFDTQQAKIAIFGSGPAAEAKLRTLIKTEADLTVYSDARVQPDILRWAEQGRISFVSEGFDVAQMIGARLIYAATEDDALNAEIAELARKAGVPVNAADQKNACDFITPALVDRSPVTISIGTEGTSPSLARALKKDLEDRLPSTLGKLAGKLKTLRAKVAQSLPSLADRQRFWADIFGGADLTHQLHQSAQDIEANVEAKLNAPDTDMVLRGHVSLVGAGPGNPDLMTQQAKQKLHAADVIIYDRLVSDAVLECARREAEYIYVGKTPGGTSTPQTEINRLIVEHAERGLHVVRLKGGDPLVFGRAEEEIDALETANIPYDIAPGITSAAAAAASMGRSLTKRGENTSVTLMTGHDSKGYAEQDWQRLAQPGTRAAFYMGIGAARFIQGRLLMSGASPQTPISIVENASRSNEIIAQATLATLPQTLEAYAIKGPAVIMLGYVANPAAVTLPKLAEEDAS